MRGRNPAATILKMLGGYGVKYVFGLPGETTLPWYNCWHDFPDIRHILARDERSAAFMADAYSRLSFTPGVCEGPSVGSTHMIPGVAEAYKAGVPMLVFTTDIPLHTEHKNMLTGLDQTALYRGITKESMTVTKAVEIPALIRRAFRLMTTARTGPVHIRIPSNVFEEEMDEENHYVQREFSKYPSHRLVPEVAKMAEALDLLMAAERPLMICGQGVLFSQAWDEVTELAELLGIPVGTSITGKGSIAEIHPLSIGVVGARGGTSFSNHIVEEADLLFYIGCNTDSATTDGWRLPSPNSLPAIVQLDISEYEVGNNFPTAVNLIGDAKATLRGMIEIAGKTRDQKGGDSPRVARLAEQAQVYHEYVADLMNRTDRPIHPMRFIKALSAVLPERHVIVSDPGISAIYASAFYREPKAGRHIIFNYALGALGYAVPASVGAHFARPESCIVALTGDGSFGFTAGELETLGRIDANINVIQFNNGTYGWIRAETCLSRGWEPFGEGFRAVDYSAIAEGFGLRTYAIEDPAEAESVLRKAFSSDGPTFVSIEVESEETMVPPVPEWIETAKRLKKDFVY